MHFDKIQMPEVEITFSQFEGLKTIEYNLMLLPTSKGAVHKQLENIQQALKTFLKNENISEHAMVFQRFFVSDLTNQADIIKSNELFNGDCAVSVVQQSPLNGIKVGLHTCLVVGDIEKEKNGSRFIFKHSGYSHIYTTQMHGDHSTGNSYDQTAHIFSDYLDVLKGQGLTLNEHCIRTWFYVRDIDNNYAGMVQARNKVFEQHALTKNSHFITSTGIEGRYVDPSVMVLMDAYAVGGIKPEQIKFLEALDYLNPTHEYGVAFERGTAVDYGDRRHIFISGTASIDNKGEIVHVGDIQGQIDRAFENIDALLAEAEADSDDINSMIVYIRDVADYEVVKEYMVTNYNHVPHILVLAPVCRPGWLIEIECIAIKEIFKPIYNCF